MPPRRLFPLFSLIHRPPPTSTLFPYTTLFRSRPIRPADEQPVCRPARRPPAPDERGFRHDRHRRPVPAARDRKSTRLNSSHVKISYAVFCLKKKIITRWLGNESVIV